MPKVYCIEDEAWIDQMLSKVRAKTRSKVCVLYSEVYEKIVSNKSILPVRRQNQARKEANTRLRLYVNEYAKYLDGNVSKPEEVPSWYGTQN